MELIERIKNLLQKPICDNCLGRVFAQMLSGMSNKERGRIIRDFAAFLIEAQELENFAQENFNEYNFRLTKKTSSKKKLNCYFCGNIFEKLEKIAEKAIKKLEKIEFNTFLVGNRPSKEMLEKEEEMWKLAGMDYCEPLKAELNRELGKLISQKMKKTAELKKPEVVILFDWEKGKPKIEIQISSLFIFGYYQKLVRGIPQCKWGTPGKYKTSVEQIIAKPLLKATKGKDTKFHGMGREDIDARCLAWRAFVIEIIEPKKRKINLKEIAKQINASKKVKVKGLKLVEREMVRKVKEASPDKTYRVVVKFEKPVKKEELKKLRKLIGVINQQTPERVLHRRADKLRKREVKAIKWKYINSKTVELIIKCSAGLYVKELVSGDNGRTRPSVAEILGVPAKVVELDVIKIEKVKW
ncbi:MAG TPA: tRNA pseudouridine(54/55) synthase Pus10 [Nanoarchaeota archaeon]|nr:tRNA pseudouridine(54/55) synthase Pus10 [Nanoarchaeota archaeon]